QLIPFGRRRWESLPGNAFGRLAPPKRHPPERFVSGLELALSRQSPYCGTAIDRSFRVRWKAGSVEPRSPRRLRRKQAALLATAQRASARQIRAMTTPGQPLRRLVSRDTCPEDRSAEPRRVAHLGID